MVCDLNELDGKRKKYCSKICGRKGWKLANREKMVDYKRKYRRCNREKVNEYNRKYRARVAPVHENLAISLKAERSCLRCETRNQLEVHHIKSQLLGGKPNDRNNLLVLCKDCHALWHVYFDKSYWTYGGDQYLMSRGVAQAARDAA